MIVYNTTTLNARLNAVVGQIDGGGGNGILQIGTLGMASILSSISFAIPCGTVAGGVLTFTTPRSDPLTTATGTASQAQITDSNGTVVVSGLTVGVSSSYDIVM